MQTYEVGNDRITIRMAVGPDPFGHKGIFVESIRDPLSNHEYLTAADVSEGRPPRRRFCSSTPSTTDRLASRAATWR